MRGQEKNSSWIEQVDARVSMLNRQSNHCCQACHQHYLLPATIAFTSDATARRHSCWEAGKSLVPQTFLRNARPVLIVE